MPWNRLNIISWPVSNNYVYALGILELKDTNVGLIHSLARTIRWSTSEESITLG